MVQPTTTADRSDPASSSGGADSSSATPSRNTNDSGSSSSRSGPGTAPTFKGPSGGTPANSLTLDPQTTSSSSPTPTTAAATHPTPSPSTSAFRSGQRDVSSVARGNGAPPPSVQFDEQSLLASPSLRRERISSSNGTDTTGISPASSPKVTSISIGSTAFDHLRSPSSSASKRTRIHHHQQSQQQRREQGGSSASTVRPTREGGGSNSGHGDSLRRRDRRLSRTSDARGSVSGTASGTIGTTSSSKRWNRPVVTVPSWARDESPSPPLSPTSSHLTSAASRSNGDRGTPSPVAPALRLEAGKVSNGDAPSSEPAAHEPTDKATAEATNTWPTPGPGSASQTITEEPGEATFDSPERWWTFTLPQKYRTRLHEHHLKMSFHHQRLKEKAEASGSGSGGVAEGPPKPTLPTPQRTGSSSATTKPKAPRKRRTDSSREDSNGSDYESDDGQDDGGRRSRFFDEGLAAYSGDGAAARLGESGLLNWRHGGQRPSILEKRSSSQPAERTLTNKPASNGYSPSREGEGVKTSKPHADPTDEVDLEKQEQRQQEQEQAQGGGVLGKDYPTLSFKARMEHPDVYTVHQPATPGWASPWRPEERGGGHSIEIDGYRFRPNGTGYFPRTDTGRSSHGKRRLQWFEWWKNFLIHNPFVPLLFRFINVCFMTSTLAVAIKLFQVLHSEGATDAVGSSPVVAIVFAPLTLVHIALQIWLEYFGRPIGLWTVQSKLFYTTIELIFICFWSAELSLAFDNYFTSTLICVSFGNPYQGSANTDPQPLLDMSKKPYLCRLQGALIGLVFVSLLAYLIVLTVSLFRIFVRVTGGRRQ